MIRVERDPGFWAKVGSHPMVAPHVTFGQVVDWSFVDDERVLPLAAEHGGFLFFRADGPGFVWELHTMFTPEGWGNEVSRSAKAAFDHVFASGTQMVVTLEMQENRKSRPPKSFGWKPCGDFQMVNTLDQLGKSWFLTVDAWRASPAKRRADRLCLS